MQEVVLRSDCKAAVAFTFNTEARGEFSVAPRSGILKPGLPVAVSVSFCPRSECNSWKRMSVLLAGADPQCIDLIGTGYSDRGRPPPLAHQHVRTFLARLAAGGSIIPAAQLEDGNLPATPLMRHEGALQPTVQGRHGWDALFDGQDVTDALQVEPCALDFGPCAANGASRPQTVTVRNTLPFKISCGFSIPSWADPAQQCRPTPVWNVSPAWQDIAAGATASFQVALQAPLQQRFYTQRVDIIAHAKYMRNFRLCNEVRQTAALRAGDTIRV